MSQIFHMPHSHNSQNHQNGKDDKTKTSPNSHNPLLSNKTSPNDNQSHRKVLSASTHNVRSTIANLTDSNRSRQLSNNTSPPRRSIGHPSSMSEYGFPTIIGTFLIIYQINFDVVITSKSVPLSYSHIFYFRIQLFLLNTLTLSLNSNFYKTP